MRLEAGTFADMTVDRAAGTYGYFLTNGVQEVLLHQLDILEPVQLGEQLRVFLYHDTEDRLAATCKTPLIEYGKVGLLQVVEINPRYGCFLEMGLSRHLLLPFSEMSELPLLQPKPGDHVYVLLDRDRQGRMLAKSAIEPDLRPLAFSAPESWFNQEIEGIVYKTLKTGSFVICGRGVLGFGAIGMIHADERTRPLRVGESVTARVSFVRPDGRVNLSMRQVKEVGRVEDAENILTYLRERPSQAMPYSDNSPADIIRDKFGVSKSAFKRALGKLMKDGTVTQRDGWTYLEQPKEPSSDVL